MKPGRGKHKGGAFERQICRELSMWWTKGKRDDVFWRTATSGGRATVRNKSGKATYGGAGDIQAMHSVGEPLIEACTFELKCGYPQGRLDYFIENPNKKHLWSLWVKQAEQQSKFTNSNWMIIRRRDRCETIIASPLIFKLTDRLPVFMFGHTDFAVCHFRNFIATVSPKYFMAITC